MALVAASLYFVFRGLWESRTELLAWRPSLAVVIVGTVAAILYGVSQLLLSTAWRQLLMWCGQRDARSRECHAVYGQTQIAKYVPGNIFHFAGRHVLGHRRGFSHLALAGASVYEILGLLFVGTMIAGIGIVAFDLYGVSLSVEQSIVFGAMALGLLVGINLVAPRVARYRGIKLPARSIRQVIKGMATTHGLYAAFFFHAGILLVAIVYAVAGPIDSTEAGLVITVFAVAWTAGFITPGAPGGIGVREAVFVMLLGGLIGQAESLLVSVIFRMVTILGDLVFFLIGYGIRAEGNCASS